jgi:hypothetical protein
MGGIHERGSLLGGWSRHHSCCKRVSKHNLALFYFSYSVVHTSTPSRPLGWLCVRLHHCTPAQFEGWNQPSL